MLLSLLTLSLLYSGHGAGEARLQAAEPAGPQAVLRGRTIELKPLGASLEIPQDWLDWQAKFQNSIHLSPAELARVRVGESEWDREYGEIVDSFLLFDGCLFHIGNDGWGRNAASYHDVQMRMYLVDWSPKEIMERAAKAGPSKAFEFSKKVTLQRSEFQDWQRVTLSYDLWFSDYGGTANVDVFSRTLAKQTAVLVFMYANSPQDARGQISKIVKSFRWQRKGDITDY